MKSFVFARLSQKHKSKKPSQFMSNVRNVAAYVMYPFCFHLTNVFSNVPI